MCTTWGIFSCPQTEHSLTSAISVEKNAWCESSFILAQKALQPEPFLWSHAYITGILFDRKSTGTLYVWAVLFCFPLISVHKDLLPALFLYIKMPSMKAASLSSEYVSICLRSKCVFNCFGVRCFTPVLDCLGPWWMLANVHRQPCVSDSFIMLLKDLQMGILTSTLARVTVFTILLGRILFHQRSRRSQTWGKFIIQRWRSDYSNKWLST